MRTKLPSLSIGQKKYSPIIGPKSGFNIKEDEKNDDIDEPEDFEEQVPALHLVHPLAPLFENVPSGQVEQDTAPIPLYVPASQFTQELYPGGA